MALLQIVGILAWEISLIDSDLEEVICGSLARITLYRGRRGTGLQASNLLHVKALDMQVS